MSVSVARGEPVQWSTAPRPLPSSGRATSTWTSTAGCSERRRRTTNARSGDRLAGPCIVEEPATTVLVLPGQSVTLDELSNLVIEEDA